MSPRHPLSICPGEGQHAIPRATAETTVPRPSPRVQSSNGHFRRGDDEARQALARLCPVVEEGRSGVGGTDGGDLLGSLRVAS
jgi:hypothetical protein